MGFFTALSFLTIFPVPDRWGGNTSDLGKSLSYFPAAGLVLGAILAAIYYGFSFILPSPVVKALLIIVMAIMTGAHHLDGLIDSFDGAVSGKSRERRLEIMTDSHVGAFGIIAAILLLLLKYASLISLDEGMLMPALLLMPALSRWIMVSAIFTFPYARNAGLGLSFKQGTKWQRFTAATITALFASWLLMGLCGIALTAVLWLTTLAFPATSILVWEGLPATSMEPLMRFRRCWYLSLL